MLGVHWIADAVGCRADRLTVPAIRDALIELPERLALSRVGEPQLFEHFGDPDGEVTIAGIVLIAESHVSVHCFPAEGVLHVDVFSCKEVDLDVARQYVRQHFETGDLFDKVYERGRRAHQAYLPRSELRRMR